ncbi:MAG: PfaD family polyunsaturated fatty acid/polyketide biosynthesis protein, partial [Desulfobacterales bacterium]|nr:PfaD family polyunsaturated fatty acid/polyketide biosynthesis protein [Desulfobacterales bacterium]
LPEDSPSEIRPILTPFGGEQENYARVLAELPRRSRPAPKTGLVKKIKEMPAPSPARRKILGRDLGSPEFKKRFNLAYACLAGGMSRGISSPALVTRMGNAGMLAFLGAYGLSADQVDQHISQVTRGLESGREFGVNLPAGPDEDILVDLCVKRKVSCIEASGFIGVTPALVRYKAAGMETDADVSGRSGNRIIVKLSRPEVAADFLRPPGDRILDKLVGSGQISLAQADEMKRFPVADAICVAADGGGPTQRGSTATLLPAMIRLRDRVKKEYGYKTQVFVGTCGGIGTPEAAASAFILGADFVLTGSINQCTPEAGTSERVKDMLQRINVQDTAYAPASVGFEIGAMVQVMSRGVFFPARAGRLSSLYQHHDSLADIPKSVLGRICDKYFDLSPESVYDADTPGFSGAVQPDGTKSLNKKQRMARIFKWYLDKSFSLALAGGDTDVVNYQVYCGPCLGAFNQWVTGTEYEGWQARHVDDMNRRIMNAAADLLTRQFHGLAGTGSARK